MWATPAMNAFLRSQSVAERATALGVYTLGIGLGIDYALFIVTRFREQLGRGVVVGEGLGVDVLDLDSHVVLQAGVAQRLVERLVGVEQMRVLAHDGDLDLAFRRLDAPRDLRPAAQIRFARFETEMPQHLAIEALVDAKPDALFLCTEPFPFQDRHRDELARLCGVPRDHLVLEGIRYGLIEELARELRGEPTQARRHLTPREWLEPR